MWQWCPVYVERQDQSTVHRNIQGTCLSKYHKTNSTGLGNGQHVSFGWLGCPFISLNPLGTFILLSYHCLYFPIWLKRKRIVFMWGFDKVIDKAAVQGKACSSLLSHCAESLGSRDLCSLIHHLLTNLSLVSSVSPRFPWRSAFTQLTNVHGVVWMKEACRIGTCDWLSSGWFESVWINHLIPTAKLQHIIFHLLNSYSTCLLCWKIVVVKS